MIKIKHRNLTVLELENGKIIRVMLPDSKTSIVRKLNKAFEEHGINAKVRKSKSQDVYRLYYGNRTFTLSEGKMLKINNPAQGELW